MCKNKEHPTLKFIKHKWYLFLILLFTMLLGVLAGYISGPLQRDKSNTLFIIDAIIVVSLAIVDFVIILYIRNCMKKNKAIHKDLMFYSFFACLFFSGLVLTIAFRLLAIYQPDSFLNKGNLVSLIFSLMYLLFLALAVFVPLERKPKEIIVVDSPKEEITEEIQEYTVPSEEIVTEEVPQETTTLETVEPVVAVEVATPTLEEVANTTTEPVQKEEEIVITKEALYEALKEINISEIVQEEIKASNVNKKEEPTMVLAVFNGPILAQYYNDKEKK